MKNNNEIIINGANPSIIWTQYMDFLSEYGKYMKSTYTKRMRANKPLTWEELNVINQKIRQQLDFLMSWDEKFKNDPNYDGPNPNVSKKQNSIPECVAVDKKRYGVVANGDEADFMPETIQGKNKIRLSESKLRKVIIKCIRKVICESSELL